MLVPGMTITSGRVETTIAADPTPDYYNEGLGFATNGDLCIATAAAAGTDIFYEGFRCSVKGAIRGTTTTDSSDVYEQGLRRTTDGFLVYAASASTATVNGNPVTSTGALAVT